MCIRDSICIDLDLKPHPMNHHHHRHQHHHHHSHHHQPHHHLTSPLLSSPLLASPILSSPRLPSPLLSSPLLSSPLLFSLLRSSSLFGSLFVSISSANTNVFLCKMRSSNFAHFDTHHWAHLATHLRLTWDSLGPGSNKNMHCCNTCYQVRF